MSLKETSGSQNRAVKRKAGFMEKAPKSSPLLFLLLLINLIGVITSRPVCIVVGPRLGQVR